YKDGRFAYYREHLPEKYRDELNNIAYDNLGRWDGKDRLRNSMSDELVNEMVALSDEVPEEKLGMSNRQYFEEVIVSHALSYTERRLMMERVSDLEPRWYGSKAEEKDRISGVKYYPWLYYEDTLPKAYNFSRINLSISLHSISSGIPLRVFDIMGAGGFIMTNYQPEVEELFNLGREIVVYHNLEEMYELSKFFLDHEAARLNILLAGYKRIYEEYNYKESVIKILNRVFN
nr:glycosyltransferase [Lachnospiraceae bacterium]